MGKMEEEERERLEKQNRQIEEGFKLYELKQEQRKETTMPFYPIRDPLRWSKVGWHQQLVRAAVVSPSTQEKKIY